jgi:hypothetical protein
MNAPFSGAQPDLTCSNGEVALDGTCVPPEDMGTTSVALGLPRGTVDDVVPSVNQGGFIDQGGGFDHGGGIDGIGGGRGGGGGGGGGTDARPVGWARRCVTPARRDSPDTEVQHT